MTMSPQGGSYAGMAMAAAAPNQPVQYMMMPHQGTGYPGHVGGGKAGSQAGSYPGAMMMVMPNQAAYGHSGSGTSAVATAVPQGWQVFPAHGGPAATGSGGSASHPYYAGAGASGAASSATGAPPSYGDASVSAVGAKISFYTEDSEDEKNASVA